MSSPVDIKVYYGEGISLTLKGNSFIKSMLIAWGGVIGETQEPIKIEFLSTGKVLYAHKETFMAFLQKEISMEQLIESTNCDDVYRNNSEILCNDGVFENGYLWIRQKNKMVLVNNDDYVETKFNENQFYAIN